MVYQPNYSLGAGCLYAARYYEQADALYDTPEKGDQIFFWAEGDDHTGIVVDVRQGKVTTIEGNSSNAVRKNTYALTDRWIYKYGRPKWSVVSDVPAPSLAPADYEAHPDKIWDVLFDWLGNPCGAAGLMANLQRESGLIAGNLQNSYEGKFGMSDREYTAAVDNGTHDFEDGAGYGLAQWTHWSRKRGLKEYTDSVFASIGNEDAQLGFLVKEMENTFPDVLKTLKTTNSISEASDLVMIDFEAPADQSEENKQVRRDMAQEIYNKYYKSPEPSPKPEPTPTPSGGYCEVKARILGIGDTGHAVETLQGALQGHGYDLEYCGGADGIFGSGTEYAVKAYQKEHNLQVDGVVGEETWNSLCK